MIKALIRILWGCDHDFKLAYDIEGISGIISLYDQKTYFCPKCGKVKKVKSH